jgi:LacI family repressor for deo operon, udp, cdd, tsx, nupC, and nupG
VVKATRETVTLRDVAEQAGVSITTVSRILNGHDTGVPIRDETRARILATAAELGYKPNLLARALRGSRSSLLGVIVRDISDPFHVQVLRGINEVARTRGYRLFLGHVDWSPDVAAVYGSMFEQSHADGILVLGDIAGGDATLDDLATHHEHVVGVSDRVGPRPVPGVYVDNRAGTLLAMEHLWQLGHRTIICVADERMADGPLRASVYEEFMREHGAGDRARVYFTTQPDSQPSYRLGRQLFAHLDRPGSPTAVFAASDTIAIGLLQAAFQAKVVVPDRMSIVGFDDIDIAAFTIPPLTTISQSGVEMGRVSANMLLDLIEGRTDSDASTDVVVPPTLVVRQSTAPAT